MIKAIRTKYKNIMFRSRLEARWARFFDLVGWKWEYEPVDLNGWIPDFALVGAKEIVYVEVKPIIWMGNTPYEAIKRALKDHRSALEKVNRYIRNNTSIDEDGDGPDILANECLILGTSLLPREGFQTQGWGIPFGIILNESWGNGDDIALLWEGKDGLDFAADSGSYRYRISGEYDGDHHLRATDWGEVDEKWARAGNRVQWRPARFRVSA